MTIRESLLAISAYPIPTATIEAISLRRGIVLDSDATQTLMESSAYRLAKADLYVWLYYAPNVGQGGQSYSFNADQREMWKKQAMAIYEALSDPELASIKTKYGYMGSKL